MTIRDVTDYFRYFCILTNHLEDVRKYVEFDEGNYKTFSIEMGKIMVQSCSEIRKIIIGMLPKYEQIDSKVDIGLEELAFPLLEKYPKLPEAKIFVDYSDLVLCPWRELHTKVPDWWLENKKIEECRVANFTSANLENMLNALAGHLIVLMYLYCDATGRSESAFYSNRVCVLNSPSLIDEFTHQQTERLPDFM